MFKDVYCDGMWWHNELIILKTCSPTIVGWANSRRCLRLRYFIAGRHWLTCERKKIFGWHDTWCIPLFLVVNCNWQRYILSTTYCHIGKLYWSLIKSHPWILHPPLCPKPNNITKCQNIVNHNIFNNNIGNNNAKCKMLFWPTIDPDKVTLMNITFASPSYQ